MKSAREITLELPLGCGCCMPSEIEEIIEQALISYGQECANETLEKFATNIEQEYVDGRISSREYEWNRFIARKIRAFKSTAKETE